MEDTTIIIIAVALLALVVVSPGPCICDLENQPDLQGELSA
jgi:hypothetical protein